MATDAVGPGPTGVDAPTTAGWVGQQARDARLAQMTRRRREAEQQITAFTGFLERLADSLRSALADGRKDYARELLSRRLALRARLSEVEGRHRLLLEQERRLVLEAGAPVPAPAPAPRPAPVGSRPFPEPVAPPTPVVGLR